jgi:hypothetical protein
MRTREQLLDEKEALEEEAYYIRVHFDHMTHFDEADLEDDDYAMWGELLQLERRITEIERALRD